MSSRLSQSSFHFIGIGGIGMSGLAELLHNMGARVTGSDLSVNQQVERLRTLGIPVAIGHAAENVASPDVVVYSSAVSLSNPEVREAKRRAIPIIRRAEALAEVMRLKRGIAVGGTHGKTTTTSMVSSVFLNAGLSPTIVVGGRLDLIQSTASLGQGEWLIAEADESDGSFSLLSPEIAIVTNIDRDHLDHYRNFEHLKRAFFDFAASVPFYGTAIACGDDPVVREVFADFPKRILFYGTGPDNDYVVSSQGVKNVIHRSGTAVCEFQLKVPGRHNVLNAVAAFVAASEAGLTPEQSCLGLAKYNGVDRRLQFRGAFKGVELWDDYGHHPTEIRATLSGLREKFPDRRIVTIFQPHRYSRTEMCWNDFLSCFRDSNLVCVLDIYGAGEKPIPGVDSRRLAQEISGTKAKYLTAEDAAKSVASELQSGDILLTLGAGDVWKLGLKIKEGQ